VALSCHSEAELLAVKRAAKAQLVRANVMITSVRGTDGLQHVKAVMAVGPAPHAVMKALTSHLKRLK